MTGMAAEALAAGMLAAVLAFALVRPKGASEAVAALPAALVVVASGTLAPGAAWQEMRDLAPVVGFLAAVLVLSDRSRAEGVFDYCGGLMATRSLGRPTRLLGWVFALSALVTAVLSLDATVVLLTPVVFATASSSGVRPRPFVYACGHVANAGSLLLPVSNLTNLLALQASGISFARFGLLMCLPWLAALGVEYVVFRRFFARDLQLSAFAGHPAEHCKRPTVALVVLALTLVGFLVGPAMGIAPAFVAAGGALVLAVRGLARRTARPTRLVGALNIPFLAFVLALGVLVRAVLDNGLADSLARFVPAHGSFFDLLAWAGIAALLANLVNNLPAVLALLPLAVAGGGTAPVLAVLIGVNIGPNLTFVGSLATLLWRRIVHAHDHRAPLGEYTTLGVIVTPLALVAGVCGLWVALQLFGGSMP